MAKVLLVEDDNNLREIYEARLQAEGYDTVTASDGEQALVVAKEAKPDLVISDVMMPKISGFEMLDILRNTDGLNDVKVIMLTALGQSEDKNRADQLGADKYLVKSQVTLEDIVKTAHQLLDDSAAAEILAPAAPVVSEPVAAPAPIAVAEDSVDTVAAPANATEAAEAAAATEAATSTADEAKAMQTQIDSFAAQPAIDPPVVELNPVLTPVPSAEVAVDPPIVAAVPAPEVIEPTVTPVDAAIDVAPAADIIPPVVAVEPVIIEPTPVPTATTVHDDQVMADAVDSLNVTNEAQKPSEVTAVEVAPPAEVVPAPAAEVAPATPVPAVVEAEESTTGADGVTIAHKKVIRPITGGADTKPDINQLLAAEQAAAAANEPVIPAPAATTVVPTPEPEVTPAGTTAPVVSSNLPNPNDISL